MNKAAPSPPDHKTADPKTRPEGSEPMWSLLVVIWAVTLVFSWITGRLQPHDVADSASYLNYPLSSLDAALRSIRTPGYPLILSVIDQTLGIVWMPTVTCLFNGLAAWRLAVELRRYGASRGSVWAAIWTVALSCTAMDHQSTLATDAITASLGVLLVAWMLRWNRTGRPLMSSLVLIGLAIAAIMIRPAAIGLIPFVFFGGTLLGRVGRNDHRFALAGDRHDRMANQTPESWTRSMISSALLASGITGLLVGWMTLRWVCVDDFGVLPFGHQNLSGLTVQLVSDDELQQVSPESSRLVRAFLKHRNQAADRGLVLADSAGAGEPGHQTGMTSVTLTIEGRWNDLIYQAMVPAAKEVIGDDPISQHRAISKLNIAILKNYPFRYLRWLMLGIRRAVWGSVANWMQNPFFLAAVLLMILASLTFPSERGLATIPPASQAWRALWVLAITYAISMIGFVILTSPPLGRFADAGAIFLPTWFVGRFVEAKLSPRT